MQLKWLKTALRNLDEETEFVAQEDPASAQQLVRRVFDADDLLADNPALGHIGRIHGTRELVVPNT